MLYQGLLVIVLAASCHAYKAGPPNSVCGSMTPSSAAPPNGHGAAPQHISTRPFEVVLSNTCYKEGQTIKVKLQTKAGKNNKIEGFFVQGRKPASANVETPQGTFKDTMLPADTKLMTCSALNDAVSHSDELDVTSLEFSWTAPADSGKLEFLATVVEHKPTFWVGINSTQLQYDVNCADTTATTTTTTAPTNAAPSCIVPVTLTLLMLLSTIFSIVASK